MLLFFKRLLVVIVASVALCQSSHAFALLGPRDTWQINALGYDPQNDLGDLGGPKNLGEEWRWTLPTITYAFDPSFINYFGLNGIAAVEEAIFLFNREMESFSGLTDDVLREKPLDTRRLHPTAQALGVLDLKSAAMGMLAEQLGLASAERWTWALRDRQVFAANVTNYLVIKRNFDPFTLQPSSYVNGRRLTYFVGTFEALAGVFYDDAVEISVDQAGDGPFMGSTVSSMVGEDLTGVRLSAGEYFTALTQDDIGGLRYIYRRNNVNSEFIPQPTSDIAAFPPSLRITNQLTFIQGIDAFTFFTNALLTNPTNLTAQFTNLVILSTNVSATNILSTNYVVTNIVAGGLFTNKAFPTLITNLDLFVFSEASRTNEPNALRALYPQLIIATTNSSFETINREVYYLTNSYLGTPLDPPQIVTNIVQELVTIWKYTYQNVVTNYASAFTDLEVRNVRPATWGTVGDFETNIVVIRTNLPSGGFYILDRSTNASLVGHTFVDENNVPLLRTTNVFQTTNVVFVFTNAFDLTDIRIRSVGNRFTNVVYAAYPILLNATQGTQIVPVVTQITTNRYDYTFDPNNLLIFPPGNGNSNVILQTIVFTNGSPVRISEQFIDVGFPQGTVLILDTNSFVLSDFRTVTWGLATNIITLFTNAATGEFITQQIIYQTNSILFGVYPITYVQQTTPLLRPGVDSLRFVRQPYTEFLNQTNAISTNYYTIRAQSGTNFITQTVRRVAGADIVFGTHDTTSTGGFPFPISRSINFQAGNTILAQGAQFDRGPGMIVGGSVIDFSTLSPSWINQSPGALTEETAVLVLQWGSFDSETLVPRLYPEDITGQLQTLEDIALRRHTTPVE